MLGALPVPCDVSGMKKFMKAVDHYHQKYNITIYPEAHIWPYYTGIRDFPAMSFRYPVELNAPCFAMTNTYQKRKHGRNPKIVTYLDGPFYPNMDLPPKERAQELRDRVYAKMKERSLLSNCEYIRYLPKTEEENTQNEEEK